MGVWATRQRTVLRACAILGDEMALARHLGVSVSQVVDWILGDVPVPTDNFLQLVDVVLDENRKLMETNRDFLEEIRKKYRRRSRSLQPGVAKYHPISASGRKPT